MRFKLTIKLTW